MRYTILCLGFSGMWTLLHVFGVDGAALHSVIFLAAAMICGSIKDERQ